MANETWFSSLIVGDEMTTPHPKNWTCYKKDTYAPSLE